MKVSYANLKLKTKDEIKTFNFNNTEIEVKQYLPIEDKYDLVMITLQKAEENGIYNALKLDMYFHLHLVYMYTNLSFTEKQKENEMKIYDTLESNGFIDKMIEVIPEEEYNALFTFMDEIMLNTLNYTNTAGAVIQSIINDLPKNAKIAKDIIDSFDKEKYQEVTEFAKAANGNRPIGQDKLIKMPLLSYYGSKGIFFYA